MNALNEYPAEVPPTEQAAAEAVVVPDSEPNQVVDVIDTMSLPEAAAVLGISSSNAYRLARKGQFPIPVMKIGGLRKVRRAALDQYLASYAGG